MNFMTKRECAKILTRKDSFAIGGIRIYGTKNSIKNFTHNETMENAFHFHINHKRYIKYRIVEDYEFGAEEGCVCVSFFSILGNYITTYTIDLNKE